MLDMSAVQIQTRDQAARLLTAEQVADILGVPKTWVYAQSRAGQIPTVRLGRYYRYRLGAIERWLETQEVGA